MCCCYEGASSAVSGLPPAHLCFSRYLLFSPHVKVYPMNDSPEWCA